MNAFSSLTDVVCLVKKLLLREIVRVIIVGYVSVKCPKFIPEIVHTFFTINVHFYHCKGLTRHCMVSRIVAIYGNLKLYRSHEAFTKFCVHSKYQSRTRCS